LHNLEISYFRTDLQGAVWLEWTPPVWELHDWD